MAVAIITDTAAALPDDLRRRFDIGVVPMWVSIDGRSIREDDVSPEELAATEVKTSGPSPGEFAAAIRERATPDGVLVCTIASSMSSTYDAAVLGAHDAPGPVRVLDTTTAAGAQALVVLAAATAAEAGASLDEVEARARRARAETHLVATVPNLDHLVRSGRVPNIAGWAGKHLGLAPLFQFRNGGAHALRPALGLPAALDRMIAQLRRDAIAGARLDVAVLHAENEATARELLARVTGGREVDFAFLGSFGAVMVAHTGPGLVGLAWRWHSAPPGAT